MDLPSSLARLGRAGVEVGLQTGELDPLQSTKTSAATTGLLGRVVTVVEFQAQSSKIRYYKFPNSSTSLLIAPPNIYRMFMKWKFDAYLL